MHFYKIQAEHIRRIDIGLAAEDMEAIMGVDMLVAGRDPMFDNFGVWIMSSQTPVGDELCEIVWRYNNDAWCQKTEITEEEAENYF
jgi:hypothetical protein